MSSISNSTNLALIRSALPYIPSDDRDVWIPMGMAIKSALGDAGFSIWDKWSRNSDQYNERDARAAWKSFKPSGGITIKTLCYRARLNGWRQRREHSGSGVSRPSANHPKQRAKNDGPTDEQKRQALRATWLKSVSIDDPAAELIQRYLHKRLGVELDPLPDNLRFTPELAYWDDGKLVGLFPTILGVVLDPNGRIVTLHRTHLNEEGSGKAPVAKPKKLMSCKPRTTVTGAAIPLYKPTDTLIIAEGIETALALHVALGEPCWSGITAGGLANIRIPNLVRNIIIGADRDASGEGQKAAAYLRLRCLRAGRKVKLLMPPETGVDWADILIGPSK